MSQTSFAGLAKQERIRREITSRCGQLQPLPDLVTRILLLIEDPDTEPAEIERHMSADPVLVGKLIGMVNTPFYGINREVISVADAIMVMGYRGLRSMMLAAGVASHLKRTYTVFGHTSGGLWTHSVAVASAARALAGAAGRGGGDPEKLFVIGLVHDIGKMMTAPYLEQEQGVPEVDLHHFERAALGMDHADVGRAIALKWNLGEETAQALARHHGDPGDGNPQAAILRLADDVAHEMGSGYQDGRAPAPCFAPEDIDALELTGVWDEVHADVVVAVEKGLVSLEGLSL